MFTKRRENFLKFVGICSLLVFSGAFAAGQNQITVWQLGGGDKGAAINAIKTAVPFITITPDSRAGALGDAGVATKPDISSQHWNVAKYAFMEKEGGLAISYTPWLRNLDIPDINLAYLSTYYKPSRNQVISGSLRYFSLGQLILTNDEGLIFDQISPFEMTLDAGYSRLFSDRFSGGIVFRYIHSSLSTITSSYEEARPGIAVAADLGFYYQNNDLNISGNDAGYAWGVSLSNMGTPISYDLDDSKVPLPSTLRVGGRFDYDMDDYNSLSFSLEMNKLLVPTPPLMDGDSLIRGYREPESVFLGMIQSFYDAPGISYDNGDYSTPFVEELAEIMFSLGVEYWYTGQFAIRAGYFHETAIKGNRKFLTLGVGLNLNVITVDFSYLVPTNGVNSPLANTVRFTLGFDFEGLKL